MENNILSGQRILIVEDEAMIAMLIEEMLTDFGCVPLGPAYSAEQALGLIEIEQFDAAILDVNLRGQRTTPVAQSLRSKGVPFCFATGYGRGGVAEEFGKHIVLAKPFHQGDLEGALRRLIADSASAVQIRPYPAAGSTVSTGSHGRSEVARPIRRPWM